MAFEYLLPEIHDIILSYSDRVTKTSFRLTSKINSKKLFERPSKITIKDKCRSVLFPDYPKTREDRIKYLPIYKDQNYLVLDLDLLDIFDPDIFGPTPDIPDPNISDIPGPNVLEGDKFITWDEMTVSDFALIANNRTLEEIKFFMAKYDVYKDGIYNGGTLFGNKRLDVLDYFNSLGYYYSSGLHYVKNPEFYISKVQHADNNIGGLISLASEQYYDLIKAWIGPPKEDYKYAVTITIKNWPLFQELYKEGYNLTAQINNLSFNDKSLYHKAMGNKMLIEFVEFVLSERENALSKSNAFQDNIPQGNIVPISTYDIDNDVNVLKVYFARFGARGGYRRYLKQFNPNPRFGVISVALSTLKDITKKEVKYLINKGCPLPNYIHHNDLVNENSFVIYKWLHTKKHVTVDKKDISNAINDFYCYQANNLHKIGFRFNKTELKRFLNVHIKGRTLPPILSEYEYAITASMVKTLKGDHCMRNYQNFIINLCSYPYFEIDLQKILFYKHKDSKEKLLFVCQGAYIDCIESFDPLTMIYFNYFFEDYKWSFNDALALKKPLSVLKAMVKDEVYPNANSAMMAEAMGYDEKIIGKINRLIRQLYNDTTINL